MIRNLSRKEVPRETSPSFGAPASLGAALCLCPPALMPGFSMACQGASHSLRPTFLGFKLDASLSSGSGGKEILPLAVGTVMEALPVVNRVLVPTGLLCCSLRPRP